MTRDELEAAWIQQGLTIQRYDQTLRDLLHLLDTAEGYMVTDMPIYTLVKTDGDPVDTLHAHPGTYFRQSFKDTDAVKRARELVM